ncbi:MAG TPA: dienelactone hydrolase family protein [Solirubrobacteraceae bacterium]|nr:dienelactone hydrolase family protein [Solirubrobacteraceae bacterium]
MPEMTIEVSTPRGTMPVHVNRPGVDKSAPVVIIYMDAPGIRPALYGHAERLANAGYTAVLPDLYYALGPAERPNREKVAAGDPEEMRRVPGLVARVNDEEVLEDTRLLLAMLPDRPTGPWGCVGFCMGGRLGLRAAETFGSELIAASLLHPTGLVADTPDSPHLAVDRVEGGLYLGFGEEDAVTPVSSIPPLREQLEQHAVPHRIDVFPGAEHGYTMPDRPAYQRDAAERAWAQTLELFGERL